MIEYTGGTPERYVFRTVYSDRFSLNDGLINYKQKFIIVYFTQQLSLLSHNTGFARQYYFCQIVWVLPDCIFSPTKPSFSNYPALSPSPPRKKLIHLYSFKSTTPFSPNNSATPPRINLSAPATPLFQHAVGFLRYTSWQKYRP